jgi:hypothetical protein
MQAIIQAAISAKKLLSFTYRGHKRIAEPHVLGLSSGSIQFLGYQIGGTSSSGGIPEWRRFDLNEVLFLQTLPDTFPGRRPFPSGRHSSWDRTIAIVP